MRQATVERATRETKIAVTLDLDGKERAIQTGIGFFDHMLNSFALHGNFGLSVFCQGDLQVDCHHSVEDVGIVLGQALAKALGDKRGIERFAHSYVPMDEALATCVMDISGRPFLVFQADFPQERVGGFDTCMTEEFFRSFAYQSGITLHLQCPYGSNSHHMIEAMFKATGRALSKAVQQTGTEIKSAKGVL